MAYKFVVLQMLEIIVVKSTNLYFYVLDINIMKKIALKIGMLNMTARSNTSFVDRLRNKAIVMFSFQKLLVIGMTENLTARNSFEIELKKLFMKHGINAYESGVTIDQSFTVSKRIELEIEV